jgi:hypothetical protein
VHIKDLKWSPPERGDIIKLSGYPSKVFCCTANTERAGKSRCTFIAIEREGMKPGEIKFEYSLGQFPSVPLGGGVLSVDYIPDMSDQEIRLLAEGKNIGEREVLLADLRNVGNN